MEFTQEQKNLFKRVELLSKINNKSHNEIECEYLVEQNSTIIEDAHYGSATIVSYGESGGNKMIDYDPYYYFIKEIVQDNDDVFLDPFYQFEDSWGRIIARYNTDTKILSFYSVINFYDYSEDYSDGVINFNDELKEVKKEIVGNTIRVNFDGGGDSGYVEDVCENEMGDQIDLPDLFSDVCYEILDKKYSGWEINEGSYGYITLNLSGNDFIKYSINININEVSDVDHKYKFYIDVK